MSDFKSFFPTFWQHSSINLPVCLKNYKLARKNRREKNKQESMVINFTSFYKLERLGFSAGINNKKYAFTDTFSWKKTLK